MTSTIPVAGDETFKAALKELAYRRRTSMAKLVRAALSTAYGADLDQCIFFAESVVSKQQSSNEVIESNHTNT